MQRTQHGKMIFLQRLLAHSPLSTEEREAVLALPGRMVEVRQRRRLLRGDSAGDVAAIICEGVVAKVGYTEDGKRQIVSLHLPGEIPDIATMMLNTRPMELEALTPVQLFQVPHDLLRNLVCGAPRLMQAMWRSCLIEASIAGQWMINLGRRDARTRLAHLFCELAIRQAGAGRVENGRFPMPITQHDLADMLGLTPVHVNRTLQALRLERMLDLDRSAVEILDWQRLCGTGEFDRAYIHAGEGAEIGRLETPVLNAA